MALKLSAQLGFPCFAVVGICLRFLFGQGKLCVCILHLQSLSSLILGLLRVRAKTHLLCVWLDKAGGSQPLSTTSCQRAEIPQHRSGADIMGSVWPSIWDISWFGTSSSAPAGGLYLTLCTAGEKGWEVASRVRFPSTAPAVPGRALKQAVGTTLSPYSSTHGPLPCLLHHHSLVLEGTCDFSALCFSLLHTKEENHSWVSDFASLAKVWFGLYQMVMSHC